MVFGLADKWRSLLNCGLSRKSSVESAQLSEPEWVGATEREEQRNELENI